MLNIEEKTPSVNDDKIKKLNKMIESREKQLSDMANMLADLNQQLNDVFSMFFNIEIKFISKDSSQKQAFI